MPIYFCKMIMAYLNDPSDRGDGALVVVAWVALAGVVPARVRVVGIVGVGTVGTERPIRAEGSVRTEGTVRVVRRRVVLATSSHS